MELLQLALGLTIPLLIIAHVVGVRLALTLYGHEILYPQVLFAYFVSFPAWRMWGMIAGHRWPRGSMAASDCISGCG